MFFSCGDEYKPLSCVLSVLNCYYAFSIGGGGFAGRRHREEDGIIVLLHVKLFTPYGSLIIEPLSLGERCENIAAQGSRESFQHAESGLNPCRTE